MIYILYTSTANIDDYIVKMVCAHLRVGDAFCRTVVVQLSRTLRNHLPAEWCRHPNQFPIHFVQSSQPSAEFATQQDICLKSVYTCLTVGFYGFRLFRWWTNSLISLRSICLSLPAANNCFNWLHFHVKILNIYFFTTKSSRSRVWKTKTYFETYSTTKVKPCLQRQVLSYSLDVIKHRVVQLSVFIIKTLLFLGMQLL